MLNDYFKSFKGSLELAFKGIDDTYELLYVYLSGGNIDGNVRSDTYVYAYKDGVVKDLFEMKEASDSDIIDFYVVDDGIIFLEQDAFNLMSHYFKGELPYLEISFSMTRKGDIRLISFNNCFENSKKFVDRNKTWVNTQFRDTSLLSRLHSCDNMLSNHYEKNLGSLENNLISKYIKNINSRYQKNHIKVLTNEEIEKYSAILYTYYEEPFIPFIMTNLGDMFVYYVEDNSIGFLELGSHFEYHLDCSETGIAYLVNHLIDELYVRRSYFNAKLFDIDLQYNELIYVDDMNNEYSGYVIKDMEDVINLRLRND